MENLINGFLSTQKDKNLLRTLKNITSQKNGLITIEGKEYVNFSSNDYLGLSSHPGLKQALINDIEDGIGTCSSRLMTGTSSYHLNLENKVSKLKNKEAALIFNSGYQANLGIISALAGRKDCVFSDKLNHASIVDGVKLSGSKLIRFNHNDVKNLEDLLKKNKEKYNKLFVVTESVFSMDGDISPIEDIIDLKKKYGFCLILDEAHATGVFGKNGMGLTDSESISKHVDIIMGTFSKALAGFGAYVCMSENIRDFLINKSRGFIYSTSLPIPVIKLNSKALDLVHDEPYRRGEVLRKAENLRKGLIGFGFNVIGKSQIVPIIFGDTKKTIRVAKALKEKGYWVLPIRKPTVPDNEARIRISVTYDHKDETIEKFINDIRNLVA